MKSIFKEAQEVLLGYIWEAPISELPKCSEGEGEGLRYRLLCKYVFGFDPSRQGHVPDESDAFREMQRLYGDSTKDKELLFWSLTDEMQGQEGLEEWNGEGLTDNQRDVYEFFTRPDVYEYFVGETYWKEVLSQADVKPFGGV